MFLGLEFSHASARAWAPSGALTQVSYILSGFSFLRVDLEEKESHYSVGKKDTLGSRGSP